MMMTETEKKENYDAPIDLDECAKLRDHLDDLYQTISLAWECVDASVDNGLQLPQYINGNTLWDYLVDAANRAENLRDHVDQYTTDLPSMETPTYDYAIWYANDEGKLADHLVEIRYRLVVAEYLMDRESDRLQGGDAPGLIATAINGLDDLFSHVYAHTTDEWLN